MRDVEIVRGMSSRCRRGRGVGSLSGTKVIWGRSG